jgi:hypothetical protein
LIYRFKIFCLQTGKQFAVFCNNFGLNQACFQKNLPVEVVRIRIREGKNGPQERKNVEDPKKINLLSFKCIFWIKNSAIVSGLN